MTNKSFAFAFAALALSASAASAQNATQPAATQAPSVAYTFTPSYVTTYMFRGQRLGGTSFQPTLDAAYGNWDFGVWASEPIRSQDIVAGQSDPEVDPYASYTIPVTGSLSIQPGATWYTYPRAKTANGFYRDTFEPNVAVNYSIEGIKLTPKYYYDMILEQSTYELGLGYAVPFKELGTELDFAGAIGSYVGHSEVDDYKASNASKAWGNYWQAGLSVPYQLTKSLKATAGWSYEKGDDAYTKLGNLRSQANTSAVGRGIASVSVAYSF